MTPRRCTLVVLVVFAAGSLTTPAARAQQAPAPDAATLYAHMMAAMQRVDSVHIRWTTATLPSGPRQSIRRTFSGSADISSHQQLLHGVFTTRITAIHTHKLLLTQRTEIVGVDGRFAQRSSGSHWSCQTISPQELGQWYALTALAYLPVTPHFIGSVTSATVLGTAVWRVKIDLGNRTDVLNVAQDSYRLVRITESSGVKTAADGASKTFTDFSQYGESVAAQLPQACR